MLHPSYETYLVDDKLGPELALRFVTVPSWSLGRRSEVFRGSILELDLHAMTLEHAARALELRISNTTTALQLPAALESTLQPHMRADFSSVHPESPIGVFATRAAMEPFVPMENSPLEAQSLVSIVSRASLGGGAGAVAGLVTSGSVWAVLVSVPAGIIICGAAQGIGAALDQGLRYHLLRLMNVPPSAGPRVRAQDKDT